LITTVHSCLSWWGSSLGFGTEQEGKIYQLNIHRVVTIARQSKTDRSLVFPQIWPSNWLTSFPKKCGSCTANSTETSVTTYTAECVHLTAIHLEAMRLGLPVPHTNSASVSECDPKMTFLLTDFHQDTKVKCTVSMENGKHQVNW